MTFFLVIFLFLTSTSTAANAAERYEYLKVLNEANNLKIDNLNRLGSEGWELVTCPVDGARFARRLDVAGVVIAPYAYAHSFYCLFKRKLPKDLLKEDP